MTLENTIKLQGRSVTTESRSVPLANFLAVLDSKELVLSKQQTNTPGGISLTKIKKMRLAGVENLSGAPIVVARNGRVSQIVSGNHTTYLLNEDRSDLPESFTVVVTTVKDALTPKEMAELANRFNRAESNAQSTANLLPLLPKNLGIFTRTAITSKDRKYLNGRMGIDVILRIAVRSLNLKKIDEVITPREIYEIKASDFLNASGSFAVPSASEFAIKNTDCIRQRITELSDRADLFFQILTMDPVYKKSLDLMKKQSMKQALICVLSQPGIVLSDVVRKRKTKESLPTVGDVVSNLHKHCNEIECTLKGYSGDAETVGQGIVNYLLS